jgi:hypothetical protein
MKTVFTFICGCLLTTLVLTGFTSYQDSAKRDTKICHDCKRNDFLNIPLKDYFDDIARYNGTHVEDVRREMRQANGRDIEPSRVCMYTLDTLKKFICFIETYAAQAKIPTKRLGINFHYAVYPQRKVIAGKKVGNLHTLYLTSTYYDPKLDSIKDIDLRATARYATVPAFKDSLDNAKVEFPVSLKSLFKRFPNQKAFMMGASAFQSASSSAENSVLSEPPPSDPMAIRVNQGQLCPPACKSTLDNRRLGYTE